MKDKVENLEKENRKKIRKDFRDNNFYEIKFNKKYIFIVKLFRNNIIEFHR